MNHKDIVLANAYKMRIIAEAQVKTDKVDAYMLAKFLKAELISTVHSLSLLHHAVAAQRVGGSPFVKLREIWWFKNSIFPLAIPVLSAIIRALFTRYNRRGF